LSDVPGYLELECVLLRKLFYIAGKDYCKIATMLGTKSCKQVYEFGQRYPRLLWLGSAHCQGKEEERDKRKKKKRKVNINKAKAKKTITALPHSYMPCDHEGSCLDPESNCQCVKNSTFCEKYCACSKSCCNRFLGCQCKGCQCRTRACPCFVASRECDPDLCTSCVNLPQDGDSVLYPVNNKKPKKDKKVGSEDDPGASPREGGGNSEDEQEEANRTTCYNVAMQLQCRKQIYLGRSSIHGWGAYLSSPAQKNELITEYLGELISQEEADRRGKIYDKLNRSYLFNLNEEFVVDAARKGNKIKFANHSDNPNCYSRVIFVNGNHRIGIFAKKNIRVGEELLFDYKHEHSGQAPEWFQELEHQKGALHTTGSGYSHKN